ncbi:sugar ABC transporter substrate-binding protein [Microbacterium barkeri]|uniref:Sugar ABC transporter substrate-binding protein n=1 Tax=Microbacterium barkeri TaxID=33917 RepID=A0A9W6LWP1_9MICO|nr:sugar ABC transporter substrate-binding protein [Microbacterium barkeri]MDI6943360.1 sugar ABC transporter substrate-binding protein [Microbacterium barkeri]MDR6878252.1 multiple sugar transport system substrate-binding protein [Microbacterium barkeri]GLJ61363.1 sugar ABC transporter substrate-binding protein [Microbacterium barkeri]
MHKRSSRLMLAAVAAAATGTLLAGCAGGGGAPTTEDGKTKVIFWQQQFEDYQQAWFKEQVKEFNAQSDDFQIEHLVVPADTWDQKLKAAQAAGKAPDVKTTNYGSIKPMQANGQLADLTALMDESAFDDIAENIAPFVTVDEGVYGYPLLVEPSTVLFYRADLLEAAGIDAPPTSWDELVEDARTLTADGVLGMNVAQTANDLGWSSWGLQYNVAGDLPLRGDWSEASAIDPAYEELAELYQTLYQEKLMPQEATYGYADCSFFGEGKVAMSACGSWALGQISSNPDWANVWENTRVAPFPSHNGDTTLPTSTLGGWTLTVDSKSKAQEGAAEFVQWLLADDMDRLVDFFTATGFSKYPARVSVTEALAETEEASASPFLATITEQIVPYAKAEPAYPWDVSLAFATAIEKAMKGSDIPAAFQEAQAEIEDVIKKQKLAGAGSGS